MEYIDRMGIGRGVVMKQFKVLYKVIFSILVLSTVIFNLPVLTAYAGSASISFRTSKKEITKGDKFVVSVYVESETEVGDFTAFVSYNQDILEFIPDTSFIAGGEGLIKITDNNVVEGSKSRKYAIIFQALEAGTSEVNLDTEVEIFGFEDGASMSVSVSPLEIVVNPVFTASNNNNLESLKISGVTLDNEFSKDKLEYRGNVDSKTDKLIINAIPQDSKATVSITGNSNLVEGENIVKIIVTAETQDVKEYKLLITKEKNTSIVEEEVLLPEVLEDKYAEIGRLEPVDIDGRSFIKSGYQYELVDRPSSVPIPTGYIERVIQVNTIPIVAYLLEEDVNSDFILIYAKNQALTSGFYQYDRIEQTLQRYNVVEGEIEAVIEEPVVVDKEDSKNSNGLIIIIVILSILLVVSSIFLAKFYLKKK